MNNVVGTVATPGFASAPVDVIREIAAAGSVRGTRSNGVDAFRGIPFAAAPVGDGRFAPPRPRTPWHGVLDATQDRAMAPQTESRVYKALGPIRGETSEDCLHLNIWTPAGANKAPVMVWIHGGAFTTGAGSQNWYDGERMAREQGVIVVGINSRLGALGYLAIPGLIDGNYGVLDQVAALRWVNANIAAFGGDPANVTLFGQSAGGHAIASMLCLPETDGLFHRAILQSPPLGIPPTPPEDTQRRADALLATLGLSRDTPDLLECLRAVSVEDMLAAQSAAGRSLQRMDQADVTPPFVPAHAAPYAFGAADFAEFAASEAVRRGIDVIVGWTRDEGALFIAGHPLMDSVSDESLLPLYAGFFGSDAAPHLAQARRRRPEAAPPQHLEEIVTEAAFRDGSIRFALTMAAAGGNVRVFRFDWASPEPSLRACHCADLPFTFGNFGAWSEAQMMAGVSQDAIEPLTLQMMTRWAGFARTGTPGFAGWTVESRPVLHLGDDVTITDAVDLALL